MMRTRRLTTLARRLDRAARQVSRQVGRDVAVMRETLVSSPGLPVTPRVTDHLGPLRGTPSVTATTASSLVVPRGSSRRLSRYRAHVLGRSVLSRYLGGLSRGDARRLVTLVERLAAVATDGTQAAYGQMPVSWHAVGRAKH